MHSSESRPQGDAKRQMVSSSGRYLVASGTLIWLPRKTHTPPREINKPSLFDLVAAAEEVEALPTPSPQMGSKRSFTALRQPRTRFGGDAPRGQYPSAPFKGYHHFLDVYDPTLGYTVRVRPSAVNWMKNIATQAPADRWLAADAEWCNDARADYEHWLSVLMNEWRLHYNVGYFPDKISMVVDIALLVRWVLDSYNIDSAIGLPED